MRIYTIRAGERARKLFANSEVVAFAPPLLFGISASNALVVAALILRPKFVAHWVGYGAGWIAEQLRRLPNVLQ